jgi:hypothetical protein
MTPHSHLKQEIFKKYGADPRIRLWNNPCGIFLTEWGTHIKIGIKGQADILGIRKSDGKLIGIELKCGADHLKPEQTNWAKMIRLFGGIVIEARQVDDVELLF